MRWDRFIRLFDRTFFKMAFQFLAIVFVGFIILLVVGFYEAGGSDKASTVTTDTVQH